MMGMMQQVKLYVSLRYLKVDFGKIFGQFLTEVGSDIEPQISNKDFALLNQKGSRGKFTIEERLITTSDAIYFKICFYFLSWILKLVTKAIIFAFEKSKVRSLPKYFYYYAFFQEKIHYGISNSTLIYGTLLSARTILHSKITLVPNFLLFD